MTINGRIYDAVTGLPVERTAEKTRPVTPTRQAASSATPHTPQRSATLHRRATKKPVHAAPKRPTPGRHMDISRSGSISRFAQAAAAKEEKKPTPLVAHKPHPIAQQAHAKQAAKKQATAPQTAKQVKEAAISAALAKPTAKPTKQKREKKLSRRFAVFGIIGAVVLVIGYLVYLNLPVISVSYASARAGISASYPEYRPDGYGLSQPVTFTDGSVTLEFKSNNGSGGYSITQERSSWDSTAVLDNVVKKQAGDNYITTQERGLTIYAFDGDAAWVNGGILYTIKSDAPLSGEQIRRIATSL